MVLFWKMLLKLKDQSKKYDSKKNVWVPDKEEGFIEAEIKSAKGDTVVVTTSKGEVRHHENGDEIKTLPTLIADYAFI